MQAGHNPSEPDREQACGQKVQRKKQEQSADPMKRDSRGSDRQAKSHGMPDQSGKEYRHRHDLSGKYGLGDQVRVLKDAGGRALYGLAEKQPWQHTCKDIEREGLNAAWVMK